MAGSLIGLTSEAHGWRAVILVLAASCGTLLFDFGDVFFCPQ